MGLTRREILACGPMALACAVLTRSLAFGQDSGATDLVEVKTAYGRLRGSRSDGLVTFKGMLGGV